MAFMLVVHECHECRYKKKIWKIGSENLQDQNQRRVVEEDRTALPLSLILSCREVTLFMIHKLPMVTYLSGCGRWGIL